MTIEVTLPELGDDIDSADILDVLVGVGDVIKKDQDIVEIETDKATAEVPSTHAGKVVKLHVNVGDSVAVGAALITLEVVVESATESAAVPIAVPAAVEPANAGTTEPPPPPTPEQSKPLKPAAHSQTSVPSISTQDPWPSAA